MIKERSFSNVHSYVLFCLVPVSVCTVICAEQVKKKKNNQSVILTAHLNSGLQLAKPLAL